MEGPNLCGAKTRSGTPCVNAAMPNGRCRMHGGKSLSGIAHPNFKDGTHSKYLPGKLLPRYHEALNDPELLSLKRDIAVVESRLSELQQSIPETDNPTTWNELRSLVRDLDMGLRGSDGAEVTRCMKAMQELTDEKNQEWRTWAEIDKMLTTKRRLIESERSRLQQMNQFITAEQALMFAAAVTEIVKRNVQDRETLNAIVNELSALTLKP